MSYIQSMPRGKTMIGLHVSVLLLLLALATLVAWFMPMEWGAFEVYVLVPPLFALYMGVFYLLRMRAGNRDRKEHSR